MNFIGHIEKYLKNSEFFIDIGSHSGAYLEIAKKQMKKGIIYSFEPNSFRMSKLKKLKLYFLNTNVKINYFDKVVSDKDGIVKLYKDTISKEVKPNKKPKNVNSIKLDNLINGKEKIPSVIKIDIEGGEYHALLGCKNLISRAVTHFFIELHHEYLNKQNIKIESIFNIFDLKKYKVNILFIKDGKPVENDFFLDDIKRLSKNGNYMHYLKSDKSIRKTRLIYVHFEPKFLKQNS